MSDLVDLVSHASPSFEHAIRMLLAGLLVWTGAEFLVAALGFDPKFALLSVVIKGKDLSLKQRSLLAVAGFTVLVPGAVVGWSMLTTHPVRVVTSLTEEEYEQFKKIAELFNQRHAHDFPRIVIKPENVEHDGLLERLRKAQVDVTILDITRRLDVVREDLVLPLKDVHRFIPSSVNPALLEPLSMDGRFYFLPYRPNVRIAWWNEQQPTMEPARNTVGENKVRSAQEGERKAPPASWKDLVWYAAADVKKWRCESKPKSCKQCKCPESKELRGDQKEREQHQCSDAWVCESPENSPQCLEEILQDDRCVPEKDSYAPLVLAANGYGDDLDATNAAPDAALLLLELMYAADCDPRDLCSAWSGQGEKCRGQKPLQLLRRLMQLSDPASRTADAFVATGHLISGRAQYGRNWSFSISTMEKAGELWHFLPTKGWSWEPGCWREPPGWVGAKGSSSSAGDEGKSAATTTVSQAEPARDGGTLAQDACGTAPGSAESATRPFITLLGGDVAAIAKGARDQKDAEQVITFLLSEEAQRILVEGLAWPPMRFDTRPVHDDDADKPPDALEDTLKRAVALLTAEEIAARAHEGQPDRVGGGSGGRHPERSESSAATLSPADPADRQGNGGLNAEEKRARAIVYRTQAEDAVREAVRFSRPTPRYWSREMSRAYLATFKALVDEGWADDSSSPNAKACVSVSAPDAGSASKRKLPTWLTTAAGMYCNCRESQIRFCGAGEEKQQNCKLAVRVEARPHRWVNSWDEARLRVGLYEPGSSEKGSYMRDLCVQLKYAENEYDLVEIPAGHYWGEVDLKSKALTRKVLDVVVYQRSREKPAGEPQETKWCPQKSCEDDGDERCEKEKGKLYGEYRKEIEAYEKEVERSGKLESKTGRYERVLPFRTGSENGPKESEGEKRGPLLTVRWVPLPWLTLFFVGLYVGAKTADRRLLCRAWAWIGARLSRVRHPILVVLIVVSAGVCLGMLGKLHAYWTALMVFVQGTGWFWIDLLCVVAGALSYGAAKWLKDRSPWGTRVRVIVKR